MGVADAVRVDDRDDVGVSDDNLDRETVLEREIEVVREDESLFVAVAVHDGDLVDVLVAVVDRDGVSDIDCDGERVLDKLLDLETLCVFDNESDLDIEIVPVRVIEAVRDDDFVTEVVLLDVADIEMLIDGDVDLATCTRRT